MLWRLVCMVGAVALALALAILIDGQTTSSLGLGSLGRIVVWGLLLAAVLIVVGLVRSIVRPLKQLVEGAEGLTRGQLDTPLPPAGADEIGAIAVALSEFRERAKRWDYLAYHDPLTGLANRTRMQEVLGAEAAAAQSQGKSLILMYVGLDQLSSINDTMGASTGDEFLKIAARRLRSSVPDPSHVFHLGGSHFVVLSALLPNDARLIATADLRARELVAEMSRPLSLHEQEMELAVNIGIVTCPQDGAAIEELIANAQAALSYARQRPGGGFQFYTRQITDKSRTRLALATQLRRAVQAEELRVHYQPVLNVATDKIVCAEALMRWQHPTRGLVFPGEFIQVAEETGAIGAMGDWCLSRAVLDARRWRQKGLLPVKLAVNLSARQLSEPGLVDGIQRELEHSGLDPSELELELTESTVMNNPGHSARVLRHLKSLGITLSVDDFGTGYSSLAYLQRFPLDKIKIDRSFVSRVTRRRKDELIIAATTGLAADLGLEVVAEGVETHEQMQALKSLGCHLMQGYLFSRGLPVDEFLDWARLPGHVPTAPPAGAALN
ncbi:MAG TPA: EAL domain-containing protein [Solimonas sp.]|nr:EAL domain-containing protein [Solimonas sp.]